MQGPSMITLFVIEHKLLSEHLKITVMGQAFSQMSNDSLLMSQPKSRSSG